MSYKAALHTTLMLFSVLPAAVVARAGHPVEATPGQLPSYKPITSKERWEFYWKENFASPGAFFSAAGPAAGGQMSGDPPEWGGGMDAYGKRFASQFAMRSIQGSIESGVAAAMKTDPRYEPCECGGFFPRLGHAVLSNFVTRTESGGRTFNAANVGAIYGSSMISMYWYPDRYSPLKDGFREGSQRLLIGGSFNIFREFWPEIRKVVPFARQR